MLQRGAVEALREVSFDARDDRHLSWTPMILDEEGWKELVKVNEQALDAALQVQAAAAARLNAADEAGFSASLTIMGTRRPAAHGRRDLPKPDDPDPGFTLA